LDGFETLFETLKNIYERRMKKKRILRIIFAPKRGSVKEVAEIDTLKSNISCTFHEML
jgi:hypothetical protein